MLSTTTRLQKRDLYEASTVVIIVVVVVVVVDDGDDDDDDDCIDCVVRCDVM